MVKDVSFYLFELFELKKLFQTIAVQIVGTYSRIFQLQELDKLEDDARVYKLVGPVLIPQEPEEAKSTVSTRMSFISKELNSATEKVQKIEKLQQEKRVQLLNEQQKFQSLVQQATGSQS